MALIWGSKGLCPCPICLVPHKELVDLSKTHSRCMLGPRPNTCFARGGNKLSSGTLVIRTQTLTLIHDWWLVTAD